MTLPRWSVLDEMQRRHLPIDVNAVLRVVGLALICLGANAASGSAASVHSGSGLGVSSKPDGSTNSTFVKHPTTADTISWTSGTDLADDQSVQRHTFKEPKLDFSGSPGHTGTFSGRTFTGLHDHIVGQLGSVADSRGSGHSDYVAAPKNGAPGFYTFWDIWAEGSVGSGTGSPHYDSRMSAEDPLCLRPADLTDDSGGFSLLIPISMIGTWGAEAGIGIHVSVETTAGTVDLLDIGLGHDGVAVIGSNPDMTIYPEDSLTVGQPDSTAAPMTISDVNAWLLSHIAADGLTDPLSIALVLAHQSVPSDTFPDGTAIRVRVESRVWESGANNGFLTPPWTTFVLPNGDPGRFVVPDRTPVVDLSFDPLGPPGPGGPDGDVCLYGSGPGGWILLHTWDWTGGTVRSFVPVPNIDLYRLVGDSDIYPVTGQIHYPVTGHAVNPDGPKMTPEFALGGVDHSVNPFNPMLGLGGGTPPTILVQPGLNLETVPQLVGANHWQYLPLQFMAQPDPSRPWLYLGGNPSQPLIQPTYLVLNLDGLFDPSGISIGQLNLAVQFNQGAGSQLFFVTAAEDAGGHVAVPPINLGSILDQPYRLTIGPTGGSLSATGTQSGIGYFKLSSAVVSRGNQTPADVPSHALATSFDLSPPRPNPASGATSFDLTLPERTSAELVIYDVHGRVVRRLRATSGSRQMTWDCCDGAGAPVDAGLYFASIRDAGQGMVRKVCVVR